MVGHGDINVTYTRMSTKPILGVGQQCVHDICFLKLPPSAESQMTFHPETICGQMSNFSFPSKTLNCCVTNEMKKKFLLSREKMVNMTSKLRSSHEQHKLGLGVMQIPFPVDEYTRIIATLRFVREDQTVGTFMATRRILFQGGCNIGQKIK